MKIRWLFKKLLKSLVFLTALILIAFYQFDTGDQLQDGLFKQGMLFLSNKGFSKNSSSTVFSAESRAESIKLERESRFAVLQKIKPSSGEALAESLKRKCLGRPKARKFTMAVTSNDKYNIMFCPMCKLASTFWTRFFKMLGSYDSPEIETPYDITIADAPPTSERLTYRDGLFSTTIYKNQYKFMFVRNPYTRILSAYVDKLFAPNPVFWKGICSKIIGLQRYPPWTKRRPLRSFEIPNCGSDLKFVEYIQAIIASHKKGSHASVDCHDSEFHSYCHACEIQYDFIGKMENFMSDSVFLYRKLSLNKTLDAVDNFSGLLDNDALFDTVSSAFAFKEEVIKCIPWDQALRRIWRKLQIRGVIGKLPFPLTAEESAEVTMSEFISLVKETRLKTSSEKRHKQRKEALIEIYRSIPLELLSQLRNVYTADFKLFDYESSPDYLFNRSNKIIPFGYLSV